MFGYVQYLHQKLFRYSVIDGSFGEGRATHRPRPGSPYIQSLSAMRLTLYGQGIGTDADLLKIARSYP